MFEIKSDEFMLELRWNAIKAVSFPSERADFRLDQMALPLGGTEKGTETDAPPVVVVLSRGRHRRLAFCPTQQQ